MVGLAYVMKSMAMLLVVLALVNLSLKQLNQTLTKQSRIIQVIERTTVSKNGSLAVVKLGDTYYAMSFSDSQHTLLKELTKEEVEAVLEKNAAIPSVLSELHEKTPAPIAHFFKKIDFGFGKKKKE